VRVQLLDGDYPRETRRASESGQVDRRHSAGCDLLENRVAADLVGKTTVWKRCQFMREDLSVSDLLVAQK
jgi:hypothetical protein